MTSNNKPLGVTGCFLLATCARQAPGSLRLLEKLPLHVRFQPSSFVVYRKAGKFRPGMKRQREVFMQSRMKNIVTLVPEAMQALHRLKASAEKGGVPARTLDLIELRASQINGCSVCVDMHALDLKKKADTEERPFAVAAWRCAPYFSGAERAALAHRARRPLRRGARRFRPSFSGRAHACPHIHCSH